MGRNNLEARNYDINWGKNETNGTTFKFELLNENDCRMLEVTQGLNMMQVQRAIRVSGKCSIKLNDRLNIKGEVRKVNAIMQSNDNIQQGKYKGNLSEYTGSIKIGLA